MKSLTISDAFLSAIGERTVLNAFFSSYNFEPDFFELEVIPLLLGSPAVSRSEPIRYLQLQDHMRKHPIKLALAYDNDVFCSEQATRLEVDYLPMRVDGACQHAKIALLEVKNEVSNKVQNKAQNKDGTSTSTSLILAAGSFNMTKAGWWDNIEAGHWLELSDTYAPANIVQAVQAALHYFNGNKNNAVINALLARLLALKTGKNDPQCSFYFSGAASTRLSFPDFLKQAKAAPGPIEIVSPFFAENGGDKEMAAFLKKFKSVSMLLPTDIHGNALMKREVHGELSKLGVQWSAWHAPVQKQYGISAEGTVFRKLHGKIYHCHGEQPWLFVGSLNFSRKAFFANVEAGFLLRPPAYKSKPLLRTLANIPAVFNEEIEAGQNLVEAEISMPVIALSFDWQQERLQIMSSRAGCLSLFDRNGGQLGCFTLQSEVLASHAGAGFKSHLQRSALIHASWQEPDSGPRCERILLVSQSSLFCRPSVLPAMSLQDLLSIFQDMDEVSRAALMDTLAARHIILQHDGALADEFAPPLPPPANYQSFFSEFSQVNGAFWMLKTYLAKALKTEQHGILDYYLKGCQTDSLRGVLKALEQPDPAAQPSLIVRYLTLLSVDELLAQYAAYCSADSSSITLRQEVGAAIKATEQDEQFAAIADKERFLAWIKEKFCMSVTDIAKAGQTAITATGAPHAEH